MHERKALPPRSPNDLPLFTDVEHAVPYLRRGGHVLHCELTEVYPAIANQFTANEICELRTVNGPAFGSSKRRTPSDSCWINLYQNLAF